MTQATGTEGDCAKAMVNTPSTASMISAVVPFRFSRPNPATTSAPVTAPAPEQLSNSVKVCGPP